MGQQLPDVPFVASFSVARPIESVLQDRPCLATSRRPSGRVRWRTTTHQSTPVWVWRNRKSVNNDDELRSSLVASAGWLARPAPTLSENAVRSSSLTESCASSRLPTVVLNHAPFALCPNAQTVNGKPRSSCVRELADGLAHAADYIDDLQPLVALAAACTPAGSSQPTHADLRRRAPRRPAREARPVVTADTAPIPAALCTPVRRQRQPSIHLTADDRGTRASCRLLRHPRRADQSPDKVNPRAVFGPAQRSGRGRTRGQPYPLEKQRLTVENDMNVPQQVASPSTLPTFWWLAARGRGGADAAVVGAPGSQFGLDLFQGSAGGFGYPDDEEHRRQCQNAVSAAYR